MAIADSSLASTDAEERSKRNQPPRVTRAISAERVLGDGVAAFLEHEHWNTAQAELAGRLDEIVDALLHRIADIHERVDAVAGVLLGGMFQHFQDLCMGRRGNRSSTSSRRAEPPSVAHLEDLHSPIPRK